MSKSNLSILGFYLYDSSIFQGFQVPEGLDRSAAIDNIILNAAELELLYTDFDFMKQAITLWSNTHQSIWDKLYKTTILEYNPIWNKDGKITESESIGKAAEAEGSNQTSSSSNSTTHFSGSDTGKVAAFNSSDLETKNQTESGTETQDASLVGSNGSYEDKNKSTEARTYERIEQGNIGVTSTQQLIKEEREVDLFNIYDAIANDFKNRFCLLVY